MITDEEKEELFKEFKSRLADYTPSVAMLRKSNLLPARKYFDNVFHMTLGHGIHWARANQYVWPLISKLACHICGQERVDKIEPKYLPLANAFAKEITDVYSKFALEMETLNEVNN